MLDSKSLPEIVYGSADSAIAKQISTRVKACIHMALLRILYFVL